MEYLECFVAGIFVEFVPALYCDEVVLEYQLCQVFPVHLVGHNMEAGLTELWATLGEDDYYSQTAKLNKNK